MQITLTGASGYIGLRLIPRLIEKGYKLKCPVRNPDFLKNREFSDKIEIIKADFTREENLDEAFRDCESAFYLIHSMTDSKNFFELEKICASNFGKYAKKNGVKKIIYLGGLTQNTKDLSEHMKSRIEVGRILRSFIENVVEMRAGIIIGSGSASFEMIRYTAERLPFIPITKELKSLCQPIGIRDVLSYLILSLEKKEADSKVIEIAGPDVLKYVDMIEIYLKIRGIKKTKIRFQITSVAFCSKILSLISPLPQNLILSLIESLKLNAIKKSDLAEKIFPEIKPIDYKTQIQYALRRITGNQVESIWSVSYIPHYVKRIKNLSEVEGVINQSYSIKINSPKERIFSVIKSIGGENGYYYANILWKMRALIDKLIGGIGMRSRRHPKELHTSETLDFWRVENIIENKLLLLRAEMKLPGYGWLKFEISPENKLNITAYFKPKGLFGYLYWYSLYPIHNFVFEGLIKKIKRNSEKNPY